MADFKDILNVQVATPPHSSHNAGPSTPLSARKNVSVFIRSYQQCKADLSREVLALTGGKAPIMISASPSQALLRGGLKEKRKVLEKLQKWEWKPFINPARAPDVTPFYHWARARDGPEGTLKQKKELIFRISVRKT
jgi:hypothetical protein